MRLKQKCRAKLCKALAFLLIAVLVLPVGFANQAVYAATESEADSGNEDKYIPSVLASNYDELKQAIENAKDGDVIGITDIIYVKNDDVTLERTDKDITIIRYASKSGIEISGNNILIKNIIFDGNGANVYVNRKFGQSLIEN